VSDVGAEGRQATLASIILHYGCRRQGWFKIFRAAVPHHLHHALFSREQLTHL